MFKKIQSIAELAVSMLRSHSGESLASRMKSFAIQAFGLMVGELVLLKGCYHANCVRPDGTIRWAGPGPNTVVTVGKNFLLDTVMAGSSYTAAWYMGLISSGSFTAISATDTMASHAGWLEAGGTNAPLYSQSARPTTAWSSASAGSKSLSAALAFSIVTTGGTLKGAFLSSVATKDGTTGTLFSAGLFTGGDKGVAPGDTVNVSYTLSV